MNIDKLVTEFYYGEDFNQAVKGIFQDENVDYVDFMGAGNTEDTMEFEVELETENDEKFEITITGVVKTNLIVFTNTRNNRAIIYHFNTQRFIY